MNQRVKGWFKKMNLYILSEYQYVIFSGCQWNDMCMFKKINFFRWLAYIQWGKFAEQKCPGYIYKK